MNKSINGLLKGFHITRYLPSILFFSFICWTIFLADTNQKNFIMKIGHSVTFGDKIGHFVLFGVLAFFINNALNYRTVRIWSKEFYYGSIVVLLFAILEEFTQLAFAHRTFDLIDMVFDVLGIWFFSMAVFRKIRLSSKSPG